MNFLNELLQRAAGRNKRIVFPEGTEPRILQAVARLKERGILTPVLLGEPGAVHKSARESGADIETIEILDPRTSPYREEFAEMYYQLRHEKGLTREEASGAMNDPIYFGTALVKTAHVDGYLAGAVTTTAKTVQAGLRILKTLPGVRKISSFFFMVLDDPSWGADGVIVMADPAIVVDMDAETMAELAVMTARNALAIGGFIPKVAMLSYSTLGSGSGSSVEMVREATRLAREQCPEYTFEGEIQADAAIVRSVADLKAPGSQVAGSANVLIFPGIDAANIGYKLVQRLAKTLAVGPILQGLSRPANDLSRGCSVDDVVYTAAITALQA
ncbi:phosphate acetyltransferase [bacterium]|nr:phosphate acetyltransferase [candidate division CSSED10-310 bacterium]